MANLPTLGPRGEGWVAIQVVIFAWIGAAGLVLPGSLGTAQAAAGLAGGALIVAGGALAISATMSLRRHDALTAVPRPREDARLVAGGAYRLVRHPIYAGLILGGVGWSLARGSLLALVGTAILFVFFDLKRRREEAWLTARFDGYEAYAARTRRLIPWIY
jgi:protein-S-isoprenylcysteine O-methyltransferase Ste14